MIWKYLAALAASLVSAPALAVGMAGDYDLTVISGEFEGVMLDGQATYDGERDYGNPNSDYIVIELEGLPIRIAFEAAFGKYYYDDGYFDPYSEISYSAYIDLPPGTDKRVVNGTGRETDSDTDQGSFSFDLNRVNGEFYAGGQVYHLNSILILDLSYAKASTEFGAVIGGGRVAYSDGYAEQVFTQGNFVLTNGRVVSSAVPEPATWAMMIAGFGVVGSVARRRKRKLASA